MRIIVFRRQTLLELVFRDGSALVSWQSIYKSDERSKSCEGYKLPIIWFSFAFSFASSSTTQKTNVSRCHAIRVTQHVYTILNHIHVGISSYYCPTSQSAIQILEILLINTCLLTSHLFAWILRIIAILAKIFKLQLNHLQLLQILKSDDFNIKFNSLENTDY